MIKGILFGVILTSLMLTTSPTLAAIPINNVRLPPGFKITVYADHVPNARQMTLGKNGVVFVGSRRADNVYAIIPNTNKTKAAKTITIAKGLNHPNGVAFHDGALYVAETHRILRYPDIQANLNKPPTPQVVVDNLPTNEHHGSRYIKFGPKGWLYISIGAPCNVCVSKDKRFATIVRMQPNGKNEEIYAEGVRNSLGFAWQPTTKELWFTDNGRDWTGDNSPPDKLNRASKTGQHFGFPYWHAKDMPDPKFGKLRSKEDVTFPEQELGAHVAALGMVFYTGKMFPKYYRDQILIAEHGSWNRSKKVGYRITMVPLKDGKPRAYKPFATGWLKSQRNWGRPVDLLVMPDGSLLVSDDFAGAIYRITYSHKG